MGQERLASILSPHKPGLHLIAVAELVAQPMAVFRPQVAFLVTLALIERHAARRHQLMMAVLSDILDAWWFLAIVIVLLVYIYKIGEQSSLRVVQFPDHRQLAERLHPPVAPQIFHDTLHLLGREEGKFLQLFPGHAIDIHRMLLQLAQQLIGLLPRRRTSIFCRHHLVQILLPRPLLLGHHARRQPQP